MTERTLALELFLAAARTMSFLDAGRELGLSRGSVSRLIGSLERESGVSFVIRDAAKLSFTSEGKRLLSRLKGAPDSAARSLSMVTDDQILAGPLHVVVSGGQPAGEIVPHLAPFLAMHPSLKVELKIHEELDVQVLEKCDLHLRFSHALGADIDRSVVLKTWRRVLVASPSYLARRGTPAVPGDLPGHALISVAGDVLDRWTLSKASRSESILVYGTLGVGVAGAIDAAAIAGLGIGLSSLATCGDAIRSGALVEVLGDWDCGRVELSATFAAGMSPRPSATALLTHLIGSYS